MLAVHTNLPPTFGTGVSSGLRYLANGADQIPPNPCFPPTTLFGFTTEFRLWPPDPVGGITVAQPLQVQFDLTIDADGKPQEGVVTSISSGCNPTVGDCP